RPPRPPQCPDPPTIQPRLEGQGSRIPPRSLRRVLERPPEHSPLVFYPRGKPKMKSKTRHYSSDLPAMDTVTALTLVLAEETVRSLLPKVAMDKIGYRFESARKHLENMQANGFTKWSQRVRAIPNGKSLIAAEIDPDIWEQLTDALLNGYAVDVEYLSRFKGELKSFTLHPQGLVARDSSSYLLATVNEHDDIRQFALHRFRRAQPSAQLYRACPEFNVQAYIDQGAFGFPLEEGTV